MGLIADIVAGIFGPFMTSVTAIFTKKEDVKLEEFKVDGKVDLGLVQAHIDIIKAQEDLLKAGTHDQGTRWLQYLFGYPLGFYYAKIIVWDKILGLGSTDPLKGDVSTYSLWIVGFLFLHSTVTEWGRKT